MEEKLAFIKFNGYDKDDNPLYTFYFSSDPDSVWGDDWNLCPASIVRNIMVEENFIQSEYSVVCDVELELCTKSNCFSMQDSIDGIIAFAYYVGEDDNFKIMFADDKESVIENLGKHALSFERIEIETKSAIDDLIDALDESDDGEGGEDE